MTAQVVDFYFDLSSPYSYLAATQMEAITAPHAVVHWRPVVLLAVFKATGNTIPASCAAKAKWMLGDLHRWAQRYGVPFQFSSRFPVNAMKAHRMIVAVGDAVGAAKLSRGLFDAVWVHDRDINDDAVLRELAQSAGLDGQGLLAATETQSVKDALRLETDQAIARGMFGAPALFLEEQLFWGNDRLEFLQAALRG